MSIFRRPKQTEAAKPKAALTAVRGRSLWTRLKESIGVTRVGFDSGGVKRLPHPQSMSRYAELCRDPTVSVAIDIKRDMVVPDFYFEIPEEDIVKSTQQKGMNPTEEPDGTSTPNIKVQFGKQKIEAIVQPELGTVSKDVNPKIPVKLIDEPEQVDAEHPNKKKLEEWKKNTKATKKLKQIVSTMISKGFCPVEITEDYNLKVLPPESFYIYRDKEGNNKKYTQEDSTQILNTWEGAKMDDIILFINDEDTDHPYGEAWVESLEGLLDTRTDLNIDIPKMIHRFSAPTMIVRANGDVSVVKKAVEDKDVDEALYLGNALKDEIEITIVEPDPQVRFLPYIDSVDFQILQKLNVPTLLTLKNATEASATKMMDSADRDNQSLQNELAEILEERIYKKICPSGPLPLHRWGAPKEVLDDMTLDQIASLTDKSISKRQAQDLIRKKGIELLEDEEFLNKQPEPNPFSPFGQQGQPGQDPNADGAAKQPFPFQKKPFVPNIPVEQVERLNDLGTALDVIEASHKANKLCLVDACKLADRTIAVHMKQLHGENWRMFHTEAFQAFIQLRLVPQTKKQGQTFKVQVD